MPAPSAPPPRRRLFRLVTALGAPLVAVLLLEVVLRLAGAGFDPRFTVPCVVRSEPGWCDNPDFTRRFFPPGAARQPSPVQVTAARAPRSVRVVVVGESAAQGDPQPAFAASRFLEALLEAKLPGWKVEVVNTGIVAVNSYVLREVADDFERLSPDVVLVYAGNNEVVGPYGQGTVLTQRTGSLPLIRASIALQRTRVGQVLAVLTGPKPTGWLGMEMFLKQQVRASDPGLERVYQAFHENLGAVVAKATGAGAKVVVSTMATRLRDFAPFASLHRDGLGGAELARWEEDFKAGVALEAEGRCVEAEGRYAQAAAVDDIYAELAYRQARCAVARSAWPQAAERFGRARDLDTLRFRADGRLLELTKQVAAEGGALVRLVDTAQVLATASAGGAPGGDLFLEHAHPTPAGNVALARAWLPAVLEALPEAARREATGPDLDDAGCFARLALTGFDRYRLANAVARRISRPPFVGQLDHAVHLAEQDEARREGAKEDFDVTRAAYQRAVTQAPRDAWLQFDLGVLLDTRDVFMGRHGGKDEGQAVPAFKEAVLLLPRWAEARSRLTEALLRVGRLKEAEREARALLEVQPRNGAAWYALGSALAGQGQAEEAKAALKRSTGLEPLLDGPWVELARLSEKEGDAQGAAAALREAASRLVTQGRQEEADGANRRADALLHPP